MSQLTSAACVKLGVEDTGGMARVESIGSCSEMMITTAIKTEMTEDDPTTLILESPPQLDAVLHLHPEGCSQFEEQEHQHGEHVIACGSGELQKFEGLAEIVASVIRTDPEEDVKSSVTAIENNRRIKTEPDDVDEENKTETVIVSQTSTVSKTDARTVSPLPQQKSKNLLKKQKGRVIVKMKKKRVFLCKLCYSQVPTLDALVIHLDREHNIRVQGPPRIVEEWDEKEDLQNTSNLLKSIENKPRTTEALDASSSEDSSSDSSSTSSEDEDEHHSEGQPSSHKSPIDIREESYIKLKTRLWKRMMKQEHRYQRNIQAFTSDPEFQKEKNNYTQCEICWVEYSNLEKFRLLKLEHRRQHNDGEFKLCPYCGMSFQYDHYFDKHLEEMGVPIVPAGFSPSEAEDLLYQSHTCPVLGCALEFTNRKCLLFHRTKEHDRIHRCPTCEKGYLLFSKLRKHIERVHNFEKRQLPCPVPLCDKSFPTRRGISSHMVHLHSKEEKEQYFIFNKSIPCFGSNDTNEENPPVKPSSTDIGGDTLETMNSTPVPLSISRLNHHTPQTFWMIRNSQLSKMLARRAKKNKTKPSRKRSATYLEPPPTAPPLQPKLTSSYHHSGINKSINQLVKPKAIVRRASTRASTESPTTARVSESREKRVSQHEELPSSLPPKNVTVDNKRRNIPTSRFFQYLCSYCTRAFRSYEDRDKHMSSTHNIDTSKQRPYFCIVPNCTVKPFRLGRYLIKHIRQCHSISDEEALLLQGLKEDKAAEETSQNEIDTPVASGEEQQKAQVESSSRTQSSLNIEHHPPLLPQRGRKTIAYREWKVPSNQDSPLIRQVLNGFKLDGDFYCPECPVSLRRLYKTPYSVHRHLDLKHNNSRILWHPGTVNLEGFGEQCVGDTQPISDTQQFVPSPLDMNSSIVEEGEELDPCDDTTGEDEDRNGSTTPTTSGNAADPDDIITSSSDDKSLFTLRKLLGLYRLYPNDRNKQTVICPLCPGHKQYFSCHNLQRHFFTSHKGSDYLHKSKLPLLIEARNIEQGNGGRIKAKPLFKRPTRKPVHQGRILVSLKRKMQRTIKRLPNHRLKSVRLVGMHSYLKQFTVESTDPPGLILFYCPVCPSEEKPRVYSCTPNVHRHIKSDHPYSELLKLSRPGISGRGGRTNSESSRGRSLRGRGRGRILQRKQESDEEDEEEEEVCASMDGNISDGSDMEVAPPPRSEEAEDTDTTTEISPSLNLKKEIISDGEEDEASAGGSAPFKFQFTQFKLGTGKYYCPACPTGLLTFPTQYSLHCHLSSCDPRYLKHGSSGPVGKHTKVIVKQEQGQETTAVIKLEDVKIEHDDYPDINDMYDSFMTTHKTALSRSHHNSGNSNNSSVSATTSEQKSIIDLALAEVDPNKLKCPLCPITKQEKHTYPNIYLLRRHIIRCHTPSGEDSTTPTFISIATGEEVVRKWRCNWCDRHFGSKQYLTLHVVKEHPTISVDNYNAYAKIMAEKVYTCSKCGKHCKTRRGLFKHICGVNHGSSKPTTPTIETAQGSLIPKKDIDPTPTTSKPPNSSPRLLQRRRRRRGRAIPRPKYRDISSDEEDALIHGIDIEGIGLDEVDEMQIEDGEEDVSSSDDSTDEEEIPLDQHDKEKTKFPCSICSILFESKISLRGHFNWCKRRASAAASVVTVIGVEGIATAASSQPSEKIEPPIMPEKNLEPPIHIASNVNLIPCNFCNKPFDNVNSLRGHLIWCSKKWNSRRRSESPQKKVPLDPITTATSTTSNKCTQCSKQFETPKAMTAHIGWHRRRKSAMIRPAATKRPKLDQETESETNSDLEYEELDPRLKENEEEDEEDHLVEVPPPENEDKNGQLAEVDEIQPQLSSINESTLPDKNCVAITPPSGPSEDVTITNISQELSANRQKCALCDEWFTSPRAKVKHIYLHHTSRGLGGKQGVISHDSSAI